VRDKESELEDLGCWRRLLGRDRRPVKKLTEVAITPVLLACNGFYLINQLPMCLCVRAFVRPCICASVRLSAIK
jgi:hypothetical protein